MGEGGGVDDGVVAVIKGKTALRMVAYLLQGGG